MRYSYAGWTQYYKRLLYQVYDLTDKIKTDNEITVNVGCGWYGSPMMGRAPFGKPALIAALNITFLDGTSEIIRTDDGWLVAKSEVTFSEIYDGECADARIVPSFDSHARVYDGYETGKLTIADGERVVEAQRLAAKEIIITPKGETVIDFGQNITEYIEFKTRGKAGDILEVSHAEVLDKDGNFYTENYRSAKAKIIYTLKDEEQTYKPRHTFFGFRYVRIDKAPSEIRLEDFTAIVVHSDIKRTRFL